MLNFLKEKETRQIGRYRATATLRAIGDRKLGDTLPQMRGWLQIKREHRKVLTKYEAVNPTADLDNYSSSGMPVILIKVQTLRIDRYIYIL